MPLFPHILVVILVGKAVSNARKFDKPQLDESAARQGSFGRPEQEGPLRSLQREMDAASRLKIPKVYFQSTFYP